MRQHFPRRESFKWVITLTVLLTVLFETVTIGARALGSQSAAEWIEANDPPLLLQVHHMFWSIPLVVGALVTYRWRRIRIVLWSLGLALIFSDLCHHFVVLPIWIGNTGWHWP